MPWSSRDVQDRLKAEGWTLEVTRGSHEQWKHPTKPGRVTVPSKVRDMPPGTLRSIFRQAGWNWKER